MLVYQRVSLNIGGCWRTVSHQVDLGRPWTCGQESLKITDWKNKLSMVEIKLPACNRDPVQPVVARGTWWRMAPPMLPCSLLHPPPAAGRCLVFSWIDPAARQDSWSCQPLNVASPYWTQIPKKLCKNTLECKGHLGFQHHNIFLGETCFVQPSG
jgi:hypothetical protein